MTQTNPFPNTCTRCTKGKQVRKNTLLTLVVAFACHGPAAHDARCDVAGEAFARGQAEMAASEFDAALGSFAAAVAAEPGRDEYRVRFEHVRKAMALRKQLDAEQDVARWTGIARALHMFYHQEKDGHCATCPLQERVEDMAEKTKATDCDDCKSDCNNAPKQ